jgi:SAM-dependent methyltransferase
MQAFYASPLGESAQRLTSARIAALWPHAKGLDVLGLGYATPYLAAFHKDARRTIAAMPAAQGAEPWPETGPGLSALVDEARLPFADCVFDRVLLAHALEETDAPRPFLRELWRVMAPEGRLIVIAANRLGLWARADKTPFGHGRPYSRSKLARLLNDSLLEPTASAFALHAPPWAPRAAANGLERLGQASGAPFGGVLLMEAVKRLSAQPGVKPQLRLASAPKPRRQLASRQKNSIDGVT